MPIIGVTTYARDGDPPSFNVPCAYIDAIRDAGATPLALPPGEPHPERLLELIDGLLLTGGGDISPPSYGGDHHETIYMVCEERDGFEFALLRAALTRPQCPILCICRGLQVLNVLRGGTLHAHVPDRFGDRVQHRLPPRQTSSHPVRLEPNSRLAGILGTTSPQVCSWHHQAIDRLGANLRAVAWAEDGVIEAIDSNVHPWCIGVQWHPEMQLEDAAQRKIFAALVAACSGETTQRSS